MNRQAFRSVCSRTRPELEQTGLSLGNYFRQFSTTQSQFAEDGGASPDAPAPRPVVRQRAATSAEINSLVRNRGGSPAPAARTQTFGANRGVPGIIDVKSLPRGGRGGLRGRGAAPTQGNRFSRGGASRGGAARGGAMTGRGGRGGRGRGARGRGRGGKRGEQDGEDAKAKREKRNKDNDDDYMDPASLEFENLIRFGEESQYNPSLTMESLVEFMPSFTSTSGGKTAAVMENLSVLGAAEPIGATLDLHARTHASRVRHEGLRFFAEVKTRDQVEEYMQERQSEYFAAKAAAAAAKAAEDGVEAPTAVEGQPGEQKRIIEEPEESIRKAIVDRALAGLHESPKFAADPVGVARSWHLREGTYTQKDVDTFERMLQSMLGKAGNKAKPQKRA